MFSLHSSTPLGRTGTLTTAHGPLATPFFLPVATTGAMKGISFDQLLSLGAEALLCNTYHLHIHPGDTTVEAAGGLHEYIHWQKPILTDSGGFQIFSLQGIRKITEAGVEFKNHRSGAPLFIGPEESIAIQHKLGADIIMCFDECPPSTAARVKQIEAVDRTLRWAKVCKEVHGKLLEDEEKSSKKSMKSRSSKSVAMKTSSISSNSSIASNSSPNNPLLFAIIQGGLERDLRQKCAEELIAIGFDGYAVGGLAVGETEAEMYGVLEAVCPFLPEDKPRYLMGVGEIHQHRKAVSLGIDMFDCVACMREARHGNLWMSDGKKLRIRRSEFKDNHSIIDPDSPSPFSREHRLSYLHHLMKLGERYGETIACMQNMAVTLEAMRKLRQEIIALS